MMSEGLSKGRFEAFSDGVFAIAITLLVLQIHLPNELTLSNAQMLQYLGRLWPQLLIYVTSFATVGIVWLSHHSTFTHIERIDRATLILNLLLLLIVCFVPFPTALVAKYGPLPSSTAFYGATLTLMAISYGMLWLHAMRQARQSGQLPPQLNATAVFKAWAGTVIYFVATLVTFVAPKISVLMFIAVALYYLIPGRVGVSVSAETTEEL